MSASSKPLADRLRERLEAKDRTPPPEGEVGHGSADDTTREGVRLADRLKKRLHDRAGERRGETTTEGAATPAVPTHTQGGGSSMGLVHSVLRPPGTGLQMTTPPAGATRLAFSGGEGILRQQHGPRGAPIKKEQTLLRVDTQVAPKKAPAKGEGARKNPSEMIGDAATKAATNLVAFLAEHNAPIPTGDKPMRLDKAKAREPTEAAVARLVSLGGKNGKPSSDLRLFLTDWVEFLRLPPTNSSLDLFPIEPASIAELLAYLVECGKVTAVSRVPPALEFAKRLGYDVTIDTSFTAVDWGVREPTGAVARAPLPPLACVLLERAAKGPWPENGHPEPTPEQFYAINEWMKVLGTERASDAWLSVYMTEARRTGDPAGLTYRVCVNDKLRRTGVEQWTLGEGFEDPKLDFPSAFASLLSGLDYRCPAFDFTPNKGLYADPSSSAGWRDGSVRKAGTLVKSTASAIATNTISKVTGLSFDELKGRHLSGAYYARHVAPAVTSNKWPTDEQSVVGDWTPEKGIAAKGRQPKRDRHDKSAAMARRYAPNATRLDQIRTRTRWIRMARHFIAKTGVDNMSLDTTWEDIIPAIASVESSEAERRFFGPIDNHTWPVGYFAAREGDEPYTVPKRARVETEKAIHNRPSRPSRAR